MFRRQFVQFMAVFGTGSVASIATADTKEGKTVTYRVKGFSCVTCAVGLDSMFQRQKGIVWSKSSFPDGIVKIKFDPQEIGEESLRSFIGEMGFTVTEEKAG
jgi:copper chaperone CopZ